MDFYTLKIGDKPIDWDIPKLYSGTQFTVKEASDSKVIFTLPDNKDLQLKWTNKDQTTFTVTFNAPSSSNQQGGICYGKDLEHLNQVWSSGNLPITINAGDKITKIQNKLLQGAVDIEITGSIVTLIKVA